MFRRCARQYYFRYIKGIRIPTAHMLTLGSSYHSALATNYKQKIVSKMDLPVQEIVEAFSDDFDRRALDKEIEWFGNRPGAIKDIGIPLVKKYQEEVAPGVQPILVEHRFELVLPEKAEVAVPLVGYIDLADEDPATREPRGEVEHKTGARSWNQERVDGDLQAFPYILWFQQKYGKSPWFRFHIAVKTKKPKIQVLATSRSQEEMDWYIESVVKEVYASIRSGNFPATGDGWACSEKWCGYFHLCRGKGRNF